MFVYKVTNVFNGKAYIGITVKTVAQRWAAHLSCAFVKNVDYYLYRAMRKYGAGAFTVEQVYEAVDLQELCAVEKGLIAQYGTYATAGGYNQTLGGEGVWGLKQTPVALEKMRARVKVQMSDPTRHPMWGKKHSAESKARMSASAKGRVFSAATRALWSAQRTGKKMPRAAVEQSRLKRLGVRRTAEQIARIRAGVARSRLERGL